MSKQIKQMEMDLLGKTFRDVRDLVVLGITKMSAQDNFQLRRNLRKKKISVQVVKNSLTRRVFGEMGMKADGFWSGPTAVAWGGSSLAELSRELDTLLKKNKNVTFKGAFAEGQEVSFDQAIKMPTRAEAIGRVISLALSPAARLLGQISGPAGSVASQIKSIAEKKPEEPAPAAPPAT
jgi:large subunit ribosomal protein L10